MLWIEDIVESTPTPPFHGSSQGVVRRSAFWAFPSAWSGVELECKLESEVLKHQFSQVEKDLDL
jgi:hypothetical protein